MIPTPATPDAYRPHVGQDFVLTLADGRALTLQLEAADTRIDDDIQLCFALLFRSREAEIPRGIYRFAHPQLGEFELSLEPVLTRRIGLRYEAVFNLLRDGAL